MSRSMRKIVYYENILEFKENSKEHLNLNEINNWQLCRTCLVDTSEDDINIEKMSVMDVMQGKFLTIKEMLVDAMRIEITTTGNLPMQLCKECVSKISALYYFCVQVRKADKVLKSLSNKLYCQNLSSEACETENKFSETEIPDDSVVFELEEVYDYPQDETNLEDTENKAFQQEFEKLVHAKENTEYFEQICDVEAFLIKDREAVSLKGEETALLKDGDETLLNVEEAALLKNDENHSYSKSNSSDDDNHLIKDLYDGSQECDSENEDTTIITTTITTEEVQNDVKKPKKRSSNSVRTSGYRHKQPRVTSPLLDDFDCAICQDSFGRQQDLVHHVRESHPNSKAYKCRVCGNLFSHIQSLSRHMNSHKEAVILNECGFCSKSFVRADDLKRHLRIHTGERPYACSFCEKSFQQHSDLKYHEEKHLYGDMNLRFKKFECAECKQPYASRAGLYMHKRKHHTQGGDDNALPYDCSLCEKSFHLQSELKRHARQHFRLGVAKYIEYDKHFTTRNNLNKHTKVYHNTESQEEKECEKENEEDFETAERGREQN